MTTTQVKQHLCALGGLHPNEADNTIVDILHILKDVLPSYEFDLCISSVAEYLLDIIEEEENAMVR